MNILHINNYEKLGGAEVIFAITSKIPNHKNYLGFAPKASNLATPDIKFRSWEENGLLFGIMNYIFSFYNYRVLLKFLKENRIDLIHLQGFFSSLSPSILLAIKKVKARSSIKIIQTCHEYHVICPNASLFNFSKNTICEKCIGNKYKLKIVFENCDRRGRFYSLLKGLRSFISNNVLSHKDIVDTFIAPSNFLKDKLIEDGINPEKIKTLINPISIRFIEEPTKKENIICFIGRFSYEKNLPFLISTFSKWKKEYQSDYRLLLVGDGDEKTKILDIIKDTGIKNSIEVKPFLEHSQLVKEIARCKFLTLSSICYENSPLAIVEAVALDIIPFAPAIGGMNESIHDLLKVGRTYTPNSMESWMQCLNFLIENYEMEMIKLSNAKKYLPSKLSIQNYYDTLNNIYSL